jgi:L-amino acid N-acyltransferase YncA
MSDLALAPQPVPTASGHRPIVVRTRRGAITITPLRDGDTQTVEAVFERLSARARRRRFGKSELQPSELALHASVGEERHVLVARAGRLAVALAHLVRDDDRISAEVAVAVADEWRGVGIGTAITQRLAADAAAAGITRVHALIGAENRASLALIRATTSIVSSRFEGPDLIVVGAIEGRRAVDRSAFVHATAARTPLAPPLVTAATHLPLSWRRRS